MWKILLSASVQHFSICESHNFQNVYAPSRAAEKGNLQRKNPILYTSRGVRYPPYAVVLTYSILFLGSLL